MGVMESGSCVFNRKTCLCRSGCKKFLLLNEGNIVDSIVEGRKEEEVVEFVSMLMEMNMTWKVKV